MQTFLPVDSFYQSAKCLDMKRLGKQRVETYQILNAMNTGKGWINHPATKMWIGHELSLIRYGIAMCEEWILRGYKDTLLPKFKAMEAEKTASGCNDSYPSWFGNPDFHASHRSNLLRKDYSWYSKFGWTEPDNMPYVWPK